MRIKAYSFIVSAIIIFACLNACTTVKTVMQRTVDTLYVHDTVNVTVTLKDTSSASRIRNYTETIFDTIKKDCPTENVKLNRFKRQIENSETLESLTGGSIIVTTADKKNKIKIVFKGNSGTGFLDEKKEVIEDKTTITKTIKKSLFGRIIEDFELIIVIILAFIFGGLLGWLKGKF